MIENFDIVLHDVEFETGEGTKQRPVIIYGIGQELYTLEILGVYSYRKWFNHDKRFYEIIDWEEAGLKTKSFVKVSVVYEVEYIDIANSIKVGRLSSRDAIGLQEYISNYK